MSAVAPRVSAVDISVSDEEFTGLDDADGTAGGGRIQCQLLLIVAWMSYYLCACVVRAGTVPYCNAGNPLVSECGKELSAGQGEYAQILCGRTCGPNNSSV
jgi:hypothetical protein